MDYCIDNNYIIGRDKDGVYCIDTPMGLNIDDVSWSKVDTFEVEERFGTYKPHALTCFRNNLGQLTSSLRATHIESSRAVIIREDETIINIKFKDDGKRSFKTKRHLAKVRKGAGRRKSSVRIRASRIKCSRSNI